MAAVVPFSELSSSDLIVDAMYLSGTRGNSGDDPLTRLVGCGNQGGFRIVGTARGGYRIAVLYSNGAEPDWPDRLVPETGMFTYFGDNRSHGGELHRTKLGGNALLRESFARVHGDPPDRSWVPPFLIFTRGSRGRDAVFRGLAAPGGPGTGPTEDLVAVWRTKDGTRFQNYQATFTILDAPVIARSWIEALRSGANSTLGAPAAWRQWIERGTYRPLLAPRTVHHRTQAEQLPKDSVGTAMIKLTSTDVVCEENHRAVL